MKFNLKKIIGAFEYFLSQRVYINHPHPDVIRSALEYLRTMEWISVEDRLPEPFECVLIATDAVNAAGEEFVTIGAWEHDTWKCLTGPMGAKEKVTHWKPLPVSPRKELDK